MGYRVIVRNRDLHPVGEIDTWTKLDFTVSHCRPGTFQLLVKAGTEQAELLQKGGGLAIYQDGVKDPVFSGKINFFQSYWTVQQHTGAGSVYVGGRCDNQLAYNRLAFPDPTKSVGQQFRAPESRSVTGPAARAIWQELYRSLGPGALAERRVPGLAFGPEPDFGPEVADSLRFNVIGDALEPWSASKEVGWRFLYDPAQRAISVKVFEPRDLSREVRFSPELGNLREYIWTLSAPKATRAIVACQGEGTDRYLQQQIDTDAEEEWGTSVEVFVDRRDLPLKSDPVTGQPVKATAETTDEQFEAAKKAVVAAAEAALQQGERTGNFQVYPIDTQQLAFGRDYFVGDLVTVAIDGVEYTDILREVHISVEDGGRATSVAPKVGAQGSGEPLNLYRTVSELREHLRRLEARM